MTDLIHQIERVLRGADGPLSLKEIKNRISAESLRDSGVLRAVDEFKRLGFVVEGRKGVVWVLNPSPKMGRPVAGTVGLTPPRLSGTS